MITSDSALLIFVSKVFIPDRDDRIIHFLRM